MKQSCVFGYLILLVLSTPAMLASGYLEASRSEACSGSISTDIRLYSNSGVIDAFEFTCIYNPSHLTLTGCSAGVLTATWDSVGCVDTAGTIVISAVAGAGDAIPTGSLGPLVTLGFTLVSGLAEDTFSPLTLSNPLLDIAGYNLIDGSFTATCPAGAIEVASVSACYLDTPTVDVSIDGNVNVIDHFGFIVNFDPNVLHLDMNCAPGDLTSDWELLSCNPIEGSPGQVLVIGANDYGGSRIGPSSSGTIAVLNFDVVCQDCEQYSAYGITLSDLNTDSMPFNDLNQYDITDGEFTYGCPPPPVDVEVEDASGLQGQMIEVEVLFTDLPGAVNDFGFDVHYPTNMLSYSHCLPGTLTSGWSGPNSMLDCYEPSTGLIRVGAYNPTPIFIGTSGSVIKLYFTVDCPGCTDGQIGYMTLDRLVDDVDGWGAQYGIFTFLLVPPPTPTPLPVPAESGGGIALMVVVFTVLSLGLFGSRKSAARSGSDGLKGVRP